MKKLFLMMGLACLFMVACNNAPKQEVKNEEPQQQEATAPAQEHHCPFCTLKAEYANWDNMDDQAKAMLNKKAYEVFAEADAKCQEMKAEGKECCEKAGEVKEECQQQCEEMKAKCEAMKAAWEAFDTKTLDEQKDLVLERIAAMGMGQGKCDKEGEGQHCEGEPK